MKDESRDYTCTIQYDQALDCTVTVMIMMMTFITITLKTKKIGLQLHLIKFCDIVCPIRNIRNNKLSRLNSFTFMEEVPCRC